MRDDALAKPEYKIVKVTRRPVGQSHPLERAGCNRLVDRLRREVILGNIPSLRPPLAFAWRKHFCLCFRLSHSTLRGLLSKNESRSAARMFGNTTRQDPLHGSSG